MIRVDLAEPEVAELGFSFANASDVMLRHRARMALMVHRGRVHGQIVQEKHRSPVHGRLIAYLDDGAGALPPPVAPGADLELNRNLEEVVCDCVIRGPGADEWSGPSSCGGQREDHRVLIDAILHIDSEGGRWWNMPERFDL